MEDHRHISKQVGESHWYICEHRLEDNPSTTWGVPIWAKYSVQFLGKRRGTDKREIVTHTESSTSPETYTSLYGYVLPKFVAEAIWEDMRKNFGCLSCQVVASDVQGNVCSDCFADMAMDEWISL
ncbi:hypothetical protein UFOVP1219_26 [uncultured Caudovirales phage]|uniref:Uncharacterized protein n=2 Tax=uncultured Caudovirales phage TaxID=2100421 RepID=A0A6J5MIM2_9CAUD|nr:hypothetical protein UFOVP476_72 [uncultured Caudovirales phage]CAB4176024.1 hypothetical protein UFOVP986_3 [uncultured Caudovirales phage]CAB4191126.1 hypothetical protein UFOVP1219_26 [uncultured Caudovirales phage]CAB5220512.1 hypothetical protein UFOVP358_32 [uncultured Caudovirales phage]